MTTLQDGSSPQPPRSLPTQAGAERGQETAAVSARPPERTQPDAPDDVTLPDQFGRYHIVRKLGEGGMGAVFLAEDTRLNRRVAIKIPKLDPSAASGDLKRFEREAGVAAALSHPNLCPVYDVGEIDGRHFMALAYIDGAPLSKIIAAKRQPPRAVVQIVRKIALAVHEAHKKGIIHRDLKPSNVMIDSRKEPVVMDFGLARQTGPQDAHITQSGMILGSPAYMSKEQALGELDRLGPHTDVYSLGVMLYEMLTGELPFQGPTVAAILGRILTADPPAITTLRSDLDPRLDAICRKAMAREIPERYQSMSEFAAALTEWLKGTPSAGAGQLTLGTGDHAGSTPRHAGRPGLLRKLLWPAAVAGCAAIGLIVWIARPAAHGGPAAVVQREPPPEHAGSSPEASEPATDSEAPEESGSSTPEPAADTPREPSETKRGRQPPKRIFLMKNIKLPRDALLGVWKRQPKLLIAEAPKKGATNTKLALAVPVEVPTGYRLHLGITTLGAETHRVNLSILVDGRPATIVLDGRGPHSGLEQIDGKRSDKNETRYEQVVLEPQTLTQLVIEVRKASVAVLVGKKRLFGWEGDPTRLTPNPDWPEATAGRLVIGASNTPLTISKLTLEPLE